MDAITMLKDDHATVEKLFKRFEQAGDRAHVEKRRIVDRIIEELSQHAAVEEMLFYPVTRATVPAVEDVALESIEEHHIVKWVLSELERMDPEDERFDAKVTVLIENVRHHVEEEESEYFPEVRAELGRKALTELGDAMVEAKRSAPLRPHPESPDAPPGNLVAGPMAGVVDRLGATVSGVAQGGVSALQDLIDRIRGTQSSRPAPTGSSVARKTAGSVRSGAGDAVDKMIAVVQEAKSSTEKVADTARDSARQTASAARSGTEKVAETAGDSARQTASTARSGTAKVAETARDSARKTTSTAKSGGRKVAATAGSSARKTAKTAKV
jgi:hypothetical protein